jgi:hypothetical protein
MPDLVLETLLNCLPQVSNSQLEKCASDYITRTSRCFLDENESFATALPGGGRSMLDIEPEIDLLIEISAFGPDDRALLVHELDQTLQVTHQLLKKRPAVEGQLEKLTWEEAPTWGAIYKLRQHLLSMRMNLRDETSLRKLLPTIYRNGGYRFEPLVEYLVKNPMALGTRTSETILHLSSSMVARIRTGALGIPYEYLNADADSIQKAIPAGNRTRLWFENFIPQHDGWALGLGDILELAISEEANDWTRVFETARLGNTPKPTKDFIKAVHTLRQSIDDLRFTSMFNQIEAAMHEVSPVSVWDSNAHFPIKHESTYATSSVEMLRGLIRIAGFYQSRRTFLSLERVMERSFEKISGMGPRCETLGQEALDSMATMEIENKIERLRIAFLRFKANKNVAKRLTKSIQKAGGTV